MSSIIPEAELANLTKEEKQQIVSEIQAVIDKYKDKCHLMVCNTDDGDSIYTVKDVEYSKTDDRIYINSAW